MEFTWLAEILNGGPANVFAVGLALVLMVIAIGIWGLEFTGHTISTRGIVRNNLTWNARTIAIISVCAAIYIAGRPLQVQFVPGIGGFNPSFSLGPVLATLFGLPGAIGVTFSMPIGDAISGALTVGSAAGLLGHTFYTWIPYKLVTDPSMKHVKSWVRLYLALLAGSVLHLITVCGWLDFTNLLPPAVAWGAVPVSILLNHLLIPAVVAPILLIALFPLVRQWGMFHGDLAGGDQRRDRTSMRQSPGGTGRVSGTPGHSAEGLSGSPRGDEAAPTGR
jgi:hypothetical protein